MMSDDGSTGDVNESSTSADERSIGSYVVVARRYRPRSFETLVGQGQIAQALINAIQTDRVGHAYLFTGTRGVGKTSMARIFAKALNAPNGPTPHPDPDSDVCLSIDAGEDVDVLEIDGASNRGIDEIRQLRSNANVRPSRSRYKIYIIDEVHMLTTAAFNALLKTLEEPPRHVKFIFCTTDPQKIPITVLSRCQRFDFAPIDADSIVQRLKEITESEQRKAEPEALRLLARRAEGSMRDSQSLLEQLLAYCEGTISIAHVHEMLGTATSGILMQITQALSERDAALALQCLDKALAQGVDCGQLAEQLLGFFRDLASAMVGCGPELLRYAESAAHPELLEVGNHLGLQSLLAAWQILDHCVSRLRQSMQPRIVLEMALVRIGCLDQLDQLDQIIEALQSPDDGARRTGRPAPTSEKKKPAPRLDPLAAARTKPTDDGRSHRSDVTRNQVGSEPSGERSSEPASDRDGSAVRAASEPQTRPLPKDEPEASAREAGRAERGSEECPGDRSPPVDQGAEPPMSGRLHTRDAERAWKQVLEQLGDMTADYASGYDHLEAPSADRLVVAFPPTYTLHMEACERPDRKAVLEQRLSEVMGRSMTIELTVMEADSAGQDVPAPSTFQQKKARESHAMVRQAVELFDAEVMRVDLPARQKQESR